MTAGATFSQQRTERILDCYPGQAEQLVKDAIGTGPGQLLDNSTFQGQQACTLSALAAATSSPIPLVKQAQHDGPARPRRSMEEAAILIQTAFRRHRTSFDLHRRSFSKFGQEALDLVHKFLTTSGHSTEDERLALQARLILHFDINKTILISDKAQDSNVDDMINLLLSECAWGRLEPGPRWVPVGRLATDRPASDPQLMTYRAYLDSFLLPSEAETGAEAAKRNASLKEQRKQLKRHFTEPEQPGAMFRGVHQQLEEALRLPAGCRGATSSHLFDAGQRHILPSFFNLLRHLDSQKRQFSIVFRSFGADIMEVVEEVNMFATGQHPCYPGVRMDGTNGGLDMRMSVPESLGAFHRTTGKPDGSLLLLGASAQVMRSKDVQKEDLLRCPDGQLLQGFRAVREALLKFSEGPKSALALRDFYDYWKSRNERSRAGKLLLLDPSDDDTLQIFFDDNIGFAHAHIIDVRNVHTGQPIPFQDVIGRQIHKVEALNAILDPQYFVRAVHECVHASLRASPNYARLRAGPTGSGRMAGMSRIMPIANASRRGRDLWELVNNRLVPLIRVRRAMQEG